MNLPQSVVKSNFKMFCFSCNSPIERGDEITQCLEAKGMELRKVPYTGASWVHALCVPKDTYTKHYMEVLEDMQNEYPDCSWDEICDSVDAHGYWKLEEDNLPGTSIPPRPLSPSSDDETDEDDEDVEYVDSYFGPLKVDPIEKAEFEKTVDETLEMLKEVDIKFQRQNNIAASIDLDWNQTSNHVISSGDLDVSDYRAHNLAIYFDNMGWNGAFD